MFRHLTTEAFDPFETEGMVGGLLAEAEVKVAALEGEAWGNPGPWMRPGGEGELNELASVVAGLLSAKVVNGSAVDLHRGLHLLGRIELLKFELTKEARQ